MTVTTAAQSSGEHTALTNATTSYLHRVAPLDVAGPNAPATAPANIRPRYRAIMAVDIANSTTRTDAAKSELRRTLYCFLEDALRRTGIQERHRDAFVDRGDGVLALIHPLDEIPKTLLLHPFVEILTALLTKHNSSSEAIRPADRRIRIRVVVHAGEVHYDSRGTFGEALDIAFRLLDDPETKDALRRSKAPLALVVSEDIYHSIVRHGYEGVHAHAYVPLFQVEVAGRSHQAWVHDPTAPGTSMLGRSS